MITEAARNFVREHVNDDVARLLLSAHRYPDVDVPLAAAQIRALQKVRDKIPSWYRPDLTFPPLVSVEQASSEQTAHFKSGLVSGRRMADLSGGMGVDAYFFAQRFEQVTYVEQNLKLADLARHNFCVLGARNIEVVNADAAQFLRDKPEQFDLLYLDPARRDEQQRRVFRLSDCSPNVPEMLDLLLSRAPKILIKTAPLLDLSAAMAELKTVTHAWVVAVGNEVKEVLYLLENQTERGIDDIPIMAVHLMGIDAGTQVANPAVFDFTRAEEQAALPQYSAPQRYLYEPNAAILKAGAFKTFATRYGMAKLHPNTHLYTSETLTPDIPGRVFEVVAVTRYDRKAVQALLPESRASVAARNFPDSVEIMRKKLGLRDGGEWYLFGVRDAWDRITIVIGKKV